ncbi:CsbD family protein [Streptomyces sp. KR80]|uniref:CsbD family protein n=1 Tax=Streptomyces sp. KR80 TaxID=3457426 RepID=UPI003FD51694
MSERTGRRRGAAEQMKGKAKEVAGKVTRDERLRGEGTADQAKGKAKEAVDAAKEKVTGAKDAMKAKGRRKR